MTLFGSGSNTLARDTGGCAPRSKVYSRGFLGSATPFTSKDARSGSVKLAAGLAREPVNSKPGAFPSHERRQNLALVGENSARFSMSVRSFARRLAIGAVATRERHAARSSLTSMPKRPVYSADPSGQ